MMELVETEPAAPAGARILLVDDRRESRVLLEAMLRRADGGRHAIATASTAAAALERLGREPWDLCLLDYILDEGTALDLMREARARGVDVPVILLSGLVGQEAALAAAETGAVDFLVKREVTAEAVERAVRYALARRAALEALQRSESRFRLLAENATDVILQCTPALLVTYASPAAEWVLGWSPEALVGRPLATLVAPEDAAVAADLAARVARATPALPLRARLRRADGTTVWTETLLRARRDAGTGVVLQVDAAVRDIGERMQLEERLQLSQRLEAVGRLAGGVAHDFNNLLTAIQGYAEMLRHELPPGAPGATDAQEIIDAAHRAAGLTRQLLAFARRQLLQPRTLDLNALVAEMSGMLRRLIPEAIDVRVRPGAALGAVRADPSQLQQVVLNLALNARDAMPRGGTLTIETANVELSAAYARTHTSVTPGPYVQLTVSDTGAGMPPDVLARIFEPFFTTKETGEGSGLGLAVVYGIVKQSGGNIWVYSEPGRGSAFKVYLPRVDEAPDAGEDAPPAPRRGEETVLLVEDEPAVRDIAARTLRRHGYDVLTAPDGTQALAVAEAHGKPIPLLVTDVIMPGGTGAELAARLRAARPELRVLFMSGYTENALPPEELAGGAAFLQKPFLPGTLARMVRTLLDGTN